MFLQTRCTFSVRTAHILKFIRPSTNNIFGSHNLEDIKYLTRLQIGLSHLHEHKSKNNVQDTLNPLCICGCDVENTCHFLLHCSNFLNERNTFLGKTANIDSNLLNQAEAASTKRLLLSVCLSVSLIKTIFQFEHKSCFFIFIIIFTPILDCFSLFFSFFPRYWKYTIVSGDCNFFFICLCNENYDRKKNYLQRKPVFKTQPY